MEFSYSEILDIISKDKGKNFFASMVTPWHELSFEASLRYISEHFGIIPNGYIGISQHRETGYALNAEDIASDLNPVYLIPEKTGDVDILSVLAGKIKRYGQIFSILKGSCRDEEKEKFFLFQPRNLGVGVYLRFREALPDKNIIVVIVDEGLATHFDDAKGWRLEGKRNGVPLYRRIIGVLTSEKLGEILTKKLIHNGQYIGTTLFNKSGDRELRANEEMVAFYKMAIKAKVAEHNLPTIEMPKKYVLINTQPFTVDSKRNLDLDMDILKSCVNVLTKMGYMVYLKPHPRENDVHRYENLDVTLIRDNGTAQEVLLETYDNKPEYIISYFSTSLITAELFYGIKAISLAPILMKNHNVDESNMRRMGRFLNTFNSYVIQISEAADLMSIV